MVLFVLFVLALEYNERDKLNAVEITFIIYAFGFSLERIAAMQEHGIKGISTIKSFFEILIAHSVYFKGTWVSQDGLTYCSTLTMH